MIEGKVRPDIAEIHLRTLDARSMELHGRQDHRYQETLFVLARIILDHSRFADAELVVNEMNRCANEVESVSPVLALDLRNWEMQILAIIHRARGEHLVAETALRQAIKASSIVSGLEQEQTLALMRRLRVWLIEWGRLAEATDIEEQMLQILEQSSTFI